jgi:glycosyltransferase involved in cell wall biosynthesis
MKWAKEASIRAKILCHIHGQNEGITYQLMLPEGNKPLSKEKTQITQYIPDHYIACACASKEVLMREMKIPGNKITVVHESIDIAEVKQFDKVVDRSALGWQDKLVIGVVASLNYRKGADIFIEAVSIIQKQIPGNNFLFVWLGTDGTYSPLKKNNVGYAHYCQSEIRKYNLTDKLLLLGHKPDVYMYMKHMDVFVLPSRDECLPLSILEAMVLKIPVVSTAVSGIPEAINHTNGLLVQPDAYSLADGILRAIEENKTGNFSKIEKASIDVFDFDVVKQIKKVEDCISRLIFS